MKYVCLIVGLIFFTNYFSQTVPLENSRHLEFQNDKKISKTYINMYPRVSSHGSRSTTINERISAIDIVSSFYGTLATQHLGFTDPIFPDSNVMVKSL